MTNPITKYLQSKTPTEPANNVEADTEKPAPLILPKVVVYHTADKTRCAVTIGGTRHELVKDSPIHRYPMKDNYGAITLTLLTGEYEEIEVPNNTHDLTEAIQEHG